MSFHVSKESRFKPYYECDCCEACVEVETEHDDYPEDWQNGNETDLFSVVVSTLLELSSLHPDYSEESYAKYHFCNKCIFHEEMKEVFK